jgi:hypothetical protein
MILPLSASLRFDALVPDPTAEQAEYAEPQSVLRAPSLPAKHAAPSGSRYSCSRNLRDFRAAGSQNQMGDRTDRLGVSNPRRSASGIKNEMTGSNEALKMKNQLLGSGESTRRRNLGT